MPRKGKKNGQPAGSTISACFKCRSFYGPDGSSKRVECENDNKPCKRHFHLPCEGFDKGMWEVGDIDNFYCRECMASDHNLKVTYTAAGQRKLAAMKQFTEAVKIPARKRSSDCLSFSQSAETTATSSKKSMSESLPETMSDSLSQFVSEKTQCLPGSRSVESPSEKSVSVPKTERKPMSETGTTHKAPSSLPSDAMSLAEPKKTVIDRAQLMEEAFGGAISDDSDEEEKEQEDQKEEIVVGCSRTNPPVLDDIRTELTEVDSVRTKSPVFDPKVGLAALEALLVRKKPGGSRASSVGELHPADPVGFDETLKPVLVEVSKDESSLSAKEENGKKKEETVEVDDVPSGGLIIPIDADFLNDPDVKEELDLYLTNNPYVSEDGMLEYLRDPQLQKEAYCAFQIVMALTPLSRRSVGGVGSS